MYPWKTKARILPGDANLIIDTEKPTLPGLFQKKGYKTAAIGKWHLGMGNGMIDWNKKISPSANDIGFDYTCLIAATNDRVPTVYVRNGEVVNLDPNDPISVSFNENFEGEPTALTHPHLLKMKWSHGHNNTIVNGISRIGFMKGGEKARWKDEEQADFFVAEVKKFIDGNQSSPFFLYFGLHQPHVPRAPKSDFVGKSGMGPRGDAILEADWCVSKVIEVLKEKGIFDNTLIIFSSDNGPVLNDGYRDQANELLGTHKPSGPLRGGKYSLYDAGTRVPFICHWPDKIKPGVSSALVCQMDLLQSFAKMLELPVISGVDSENTLEAFLGKSKQGRKEIVIEATGRLAYRNARFALIPPYPGSQRNESGNEEGTRSEWTLYDLKNNPSQTLCISQEKPHILNPLKKRFLEITHGHFKEGVRWFGY
jgi:arylsulfatase A-like enzyme